MLLVARKNLFSEKIRLGISVGGVALSVFLIGILLALFRGWSQQVGSYVERVPADGWLVSEGTTDFVAAASVVPVSAESLLHSTPEVESVSPLIVRPMVMRREQDPFDKTFDVQLVGYDPTKRLGGPLAVEEGSKSPPGPDEIIVDKEMSKRHGIQIGDRLFRGGKSLTVVGISRGGDFVYTQVAFVTLETAIKFLDQPQDKRTFMLVTLKDPSKFDTLAVRVSAYTSDAQLVRGADFANETRDRILGNILPILIVVLVVAFIVGISVAGLTIYTATVEKQREYGILKAEGFTNPFLYRVVFEQSVVTGILGFAVGAGMTVLVAPFAQDTVPQFVVFVRWQDVVGIAGATLLMALFAAWIPVRRMASIDPVTVFKG